MGDTEAPPTTESTRRRLPSGAELGYTLLALISFAAGLYALWLAGVSAGLIPNGQPVASNPAVGSALAGPAWVRVVLACLVAAGLIWFSVRMLSKSSYLATARHLFALTEELDIPDNIKLDVILVAAGIEFQHVMPRLMAPPDDDAVRVAVAGKWVLERFREGASVVAVPKGTATSERLQSAFGPPGDRPIQILHNDLDQGNTESVP